MKQKSDRRESLAESIASGDWTLVERVVDQVLDTGSGEQVAYVLDRLVDQSALALARKDTESFVAIGLRVYRAMHRRGLTQTSDDDRATQLGQLGGLYRIAWALGHLEIPSQVFQELRDREDLRQLLRFMRRRPRGFTEIREHFGINPKTARDHLRKLTELGLVEQTSPRSPYELTFMGGLFVYRLEENPRDVWEEALVVLGEDVAATPAERRAAVSERPPILHRPKPPSHDIANSNFREEIRYRYRNPQAASNG